MRINATDVSKAQKSAEQDQDPAKLRRLIADLLDRTRPLTGLQRRRERYELDKPQLRFFNTEQLPGVELVDSVARLRRMDVVLALGRMRQGRLANTLSA